MIYSQTLQEYLEAEIFEIFSQWQTQNAKIFLPRLNLSYLIKVLLRFIDANEFTGNFTCAPLYDLRQAEIGGSTTEKMQGLGDFCLFRTGIFPLDFDTKKIPPRSNFIYAGKSAYYNLSSRKLASAELFRSLAVNFLTLANLASEIILRKAREPDILKLIQFWEETGKEMAAKKIRAKGIILPKNLKQ